MIMIRVTKMNKIIQPSIVLGTNFPAPINAVADRLLLTTGALTAFVVFTVFASVLLLT